MFTAPTAAKFATIARRAGVKSESAVVAVAADLGFVTRWDDKAARYLDADAATVAMFTAHVSELFAA